MSPIAEPSTSKSIDNFAIAVMVGLTFSWGLNAVAGKVSGTGFSPVFVTFVRSVVGALLVFAWCRLRGISIFERDGTLWAGALAGALFGAEFLLIFWGFDYTSVGRSSLMVNAMPFWVLIAGHFLLGERISARKFAGLCLAFCGVALIFSDRLSAPGPQTWIGDLLSLLAGASWAATIIVIKATRLVAIRAEKLLLYQLAFSAVMIVPLLFLGGPLLRAPDLVSSSALAFQAVFIVAFTYLVWFWLMRRYPAGSLASFTFLTPAFGVLCGGVLLGEPLSLKIVAALALIATGLTIVNGRKKPAHA